MGFKNFQVPKTLYIPISYNDQNYMTLDQYKEKYGIDLRDYIDLSTGPICLMFPSLTEVKLVCCDFEDAPNVPSVGEITKVSQSTYVEGSTDGYLDLLHTDIDEQFNFGIRLFVSKNDTYDIDHVVVKFNEI